MTLSGGFKGIGLALVERLLSLGARVIIANRNVKLAEKVLPELETKFGKGNVAFVKMVRAGHISGFRRRDRRLRLSQDASSTADVKNAFQSAVEFAQGQLSIVVANAGFSTDVFARDIKTGHDEDWINGIQGNLVGTIQLGRLALTHWTSKEMEAAFVVTASIEGMHGMFSWV